jgi:RHS repeat-associated protein
VGTLPTQRTFTGQYSDATGLMYFNARYYSGALGRFVSADTLVPGAGNPQALNRYAYSLSNPLKYIDPTGHASTPSCAGKPDCGLNEEPPQAPLPDQRCKDYGPCYDAYLTYQALVELLGRLPTLSELLYMTAATEYWSYVDYDRIPAGQPSVRAAGREGLARSYYASCRASNCSGSNLYRFLSGYEPWSGQVAKGDGDPVARAAKLATAGKDNFYGTGAELRKDVGLILNQREARSRGWTAGRSDNAPWQWFGPYETTLPVPGGFGLDNSNYAILAVDLGSYTDKQGVIHHQYFFIFTGSQTTKFQGGK